MGHGRPTATDGDSLRGARARIILRVPGGDLAERVSLREEEAPAATGDPLARCADACDVGSDRW